jgi:hypothetical protein
MSQADTSRVDAASAGPSLDTLETLLDVTYTWGYQDTRAQLRALYDKATRAQVARRRRAALAPRRRPRSPDGAAAAAAAVRLRGRRRPDAAERAAYQREVTAWTLSQFLHGEQGALLAAAQLALSSVPDYDSQAVRRARR